MVNLLHRRSIRLPHYDYSSPGWYYVTICTQNRQCILVNIINNKMELNNTGLLVKKYWQELSHKFNVHLDKYIIMPNHIHAIMAIKPKPTVGVSFMKPPLAKPRLKPFVKSNPVKISKSNRHMGLINQTPTLGHIIRHLKGITSRKLHQQKFTAKIWQPNLYEHIIRNQKDLNNHD